MRHKGAGQSHSLRGETDISRRFSNILEQSRADELFPKIKTGQLPFIDFITTKMNDRALFTKTVSAAQLICFVMRDERCLLTHAGVMYLFCQAVYDAQLGVLESKMWVEVMDEVSACFGLSEAQCRLIGLIWLLDHDFGKCPSDFRDYKCEDSDLWEYVLRAVAQRGTEDQVRGVTEAIRRLFGDDGLAKIRECVPDLALNKGTPKRVEHPPVASEKTGVEKAAPPVAREETCVEKVAPPVAREETCVEKAAPPVASEKTGKKIGLFPKGRGPVASEKTGPAQDQNEEGVSAKEVGGVSPADIRDRVKAGRPLMMLLRKVRECVEKVRENERKSAREKLLHGLTEGAREAKRMREYVILPFEVAEREIILGNMNWLKTEENQKLWKCQVI